LFSSGVSHLNFVAKIVVIFAISDLFKKSHILASEILLYFVNHSVNAHVYASVVSFVYCSAFSHTVVHPFLLHQSCGSVSVLLSFDSTSSFVVSLFGSDFVSTFLSSSAELCLSDGSGLLHPHLLPHPLYQLDHELLLQ
jgi:hypothetical protein